MPYPQACKQSFSKRGISVAPDTMLSYSDDPVKKARFVMMLRSSGITDHKVLSALETVPRPVFIPRNFLDKSYEDVALPIARGQTISKPSVVAAMTQALDINDSHIVLEIGTGSAYQTAILAKVARRVYSIERHDVLYEAAKETLDSLKIRNVTTICGDGFKGWPHSNIKFDRIIVTAAALNEPPKALIDQLNMGGVLIVPLSIENRNQYVVKITKTETGLEYKELFPVRFVPLLPNVDRGEDCGYRSYVRDSSHSNLQQTSDPYDYVSI